MKKFLIILSCILGIITISFSIAVLYLSKNLPKINLKDLSAWDFE